MHQVAVEKETSHPEVLMASQELNEVINLFYKMSFLKKVANYDNRSEPPIGYKLHLCASVRKHPIVRTYRMVGQVVTNASNS